MSHKYLQNVFQWIEYFCVLKCNWVTENILIQLKLFANWRQETQFITNMELISSSWGTYQQEACYKWATTMYISCCAISLLNRDCRYQLLLFHCCCFILYRICEQFSKAFLSIILPEWKKIWIWLNFNENDISMVNRCLWNPHKPRIRGQIMASFSRIVFFVCSIWILDLQVLWELEQNV